MLAGSNSFSAGECWRAASMSAAPALDGNPNDLLQRADEQLYAAKRAGRNRTEC